MDFVLSLNGISRLLLFTHVTNVDLLVRAYYSRIMSFIFYVWKSHEKNMVIAFLSTFQFRHYSVVTEGKESWQMEQTDL